MRMKVPITGTVVKITDGIVSGDNVDFIRPVNLNLGNVSWTLIHLDIENEEMEIEVTPNLTTDYDTGEIDGHGEPIFKSRFATEEEKESSRQGALNLSLSRMSKQALYALSKSPRLKNPFKATTSPV